MNEERYKQIVIKLTACGYIEGYEVTLKNGLLTYLMPYWVHKVGLNLRCFFSESYAQDVIAVLDYIYEVMTREDIEEHIE